MGRNSFWLTCHVRPGPDACSSHPVCCWKEEKEHIGPNVKTKGELAIWSGCFDIRITTTGGTRASAASRLHQATQLIRGRITIQTPVGLSLRVKPTSLSRAPCCPPQNGFNFVKGEEISPSGWHPRIWGREEGGGRRRKNNFALISDSKKDYSPAVS